MKRIYLVRHAKSSWKNMELADIDRPLNKRGKRDAPAMASRVAELVSHIDLFLISPAKRARQTAKSFISEILPRHTIIESKLYHASLSEILEIIQQIPNDFDTVCMFGHNPGFTYVFNHFADQPIFNLPTCGVFGIRSGVDSWQDLEDSGTELEFLLYPKMFE